MAPHRALHPLARVLPLLALLFALPHAARSQGIAPGAALSGLRATLPTRSSDAAGGAWSDLTTLPIAPREHSSVIYDPVRDRMVVFGGDSSDGVSSNDVWALSLTGLPVWTQLTPSGIPPSARGYASAIYDPVRDCMVVFGGLLGDTSFNEVWALSLAGTPTWTLLTPSGARPNSRSGHTAIYDPARDRMVVFGGKGVSGSYNEVWALSLAGTPAWTKWTPSGTPPSARSGHGAIYDPVRDRMVVFGGASAAGYLNREVWAVSLADAPTWVQLTPAGMPPSSRYGDGAIYDPVRDRMVVTGGYAGSFLVEDAWGLSLAGTPTWTQLAPSGTPPSARYGNGAFYDPVRDRMVMFGGLWSSDYYSYALNDVWGLSLAGTPAWSPMDVSPARRVFHSAVYDSAGARTIVFGGTTGPDLFNDVWALSPTGTPAWEKLVPSGTPPGARDSHSAIWDPVRSRMLVFGGGTGSGFGNDVWALSLAGAPAWTALTPSGTPPSARFRHSAIYDPVCDRMLVFGGDTWTSAGRLNDVWALSLSGTPTWTQLAPSGLPPSPRSWHSAVYDRAHDRMLVFGGASAAGSLNEVWALSLAGAPAWKQLAPSGAPPPGRVAHSAIYDPVRERIVVFGGEPGTGSGLDDVWALTLMGPPVWTQLAPSGAPPGTRFGHSAISDPQGDRMLAFGGETVTGLVNDVWSLSLVGGPPAYVDEVAPVVQVLSPGGGEWLLTGSTVDITWSATDNIGVQSVDILLSRGGSGPDAPWETLISRAANSGSYHWTVSGPNAIDTAYVAVVARDTSGNFNSSLSHAAFTISAVPAAAPPAQAIAAFALSPLSPNPARGHSLLTYAIPVRTHVRLALTDVQGREVAVFADGMREPGRYTAALDAGSLRAGMYFVRMQAKGVNLTRRVVVVR